ncbi:MAG: membrane dipeptidase [Lachnospiraceae bacterium]|nr:membrane dipeptidase [Lachnospiraceae bacterium]
MKIADLHCDTISEIWKSRRAGRPQQLFQNNLHVDIQKMQKAGYLLQNFAMYIDLEKTSDPFAAVSEQIDVFYDEMEKNKDYIGIATSYHEILANEKQGKMSALMTIEEGGCCKGELENLETLYQRGARMMTLTWNYPNELASPNLPADSFGAFDSTKGLTRKGFAFIQRMEEIGMILDVSHLSDAGFWDIAKHTKKPFAASHSNARALSPHARNLTDDMLRVIADRGGVAGLNFYGRFLNPIDDSHSSTARMAQHVRHIVNVGGIECIGLGSDFDGITGELEMEDCSQLAKLTAELERAHFTGSEIEHILYKNVMRFYREML